MCSFLLKHSNRIFTQIDECIYAELCISVHISVYNFNSYAFTFNFIVSFFFGRIFKWAESRDNCRAFTTLKITMFSWAGSCHAGPSYKVHKECLGVFCLLPCPGGDLHRCGPPSMAQALRVSCPQQSSAGLSHCSAP